MQARKRRAPAAAPPPPKSYRPGTSSIVNTNVHGIYRIEKQRGLGALLKFHHAEIGLLTETKSSRTTPYLLGNTRATDPAAFYIHPGDVPPAHKHGQCHAGVAIALSPRLEVGFESIGSQTYHAAHDRITAVVLPIDALFTPSHIKNRPYDTVIVICAYAPTMTAPNAAKISFYNSLNELIPRIKQLNKNRSLVILGGDFNARVNTSPPHPSPTPSSSTRETTRPPSSKQNTDSPSKAGTRTAYKSTMWQ
jgi:exonuclease III